MSQVYIQTSKVITKYINGYLIDHNKPERACQEQQQDPWTGYRENVIRIYYPVEYYAIPKTITTQELSHCFNRSKTTDLIDFLDYLYHDMIEI